MAQFFSHLRVRKSRGNRWIIIGIALLLLLPYLSQGCDPVTRYKALSFFFDGVPDPRKKPERETQNSQAKTQTGENTSSSADSLQNGRKWYFHPAADENECQTCHDPDAAYRLIESPEKLCLTCHDDKLDAKNVHAPVEEGLCTECHNPHGTKYPALVIKSGKDLCFKCHDQEDVLSVDAHSEPLATCTECHDPHGSDDEYLLK